MTTPVDLSLFAADSKPAASPAAASTSGQSKSKRTAVSLSDSDDSSSSETEEQRRAARKAAKDKERRRRERQRLRDEAAAAAGDDATSNSGAEDNKSANSAQQQQDDAQARSKRAAALQRAQQQQQEPVRGQPLQQPAPGSIAARRLSNPVPQQQQQQQQQQPTQQQQQMQMQRQQQQQQQQRPPQQRPPQQQQQQQQQFHNPHLQSGPAPPSVPYTTFEAVKNELHDKCILLSVAGASIAKQTQLITSLKTECEEHKQQRLHAETQLSIIEHERRQLLKVNDFQRGQLQDQAKQLGQRVLPRHMAENSDTNRAYARTVHQLGAATNAATAHATGSNAAQPSPDDELRESRLVVHHLKQVIVDHEKENARLKQELSDKQAALQRHAKDGQLLQQYATRVSEADNRIHNLEQTVVELEQIKAELKQKNRELKQELADIDSDYRQELKSRRREFKQDKQLLIEALEQIGGVVPQLSTDESRSQRRAQQQQQTQASSSNDLSQLMSELEPPASASSNSAAPQKSPAAATAPTHPADVFGDIFAATPASASSQSQRGNAKPSAATPTASSSGANALDDLVPDFMNQHISTMVADAPSPGASWLQQLVASKNTNSASSQPRIAVTPQPLPQLGELQATPQQHVTASANSTTTPQPFYHHLFDASNPIFTAGAGIASLGVMAALGRQSMHLASSLFTRYFTMSLELTSRDKSYSWLLQYMTSRSSSMRAQHVSCETSYVAQPSSASSSGAAPATRFAFIPSPGMRHTFWYRGQPIFVHRERDKQILDLNSGMPFESVTLKTWGRDAQMFQQLLAEARQAALHQHSGKIILFTATHVDWRPFGPARNRRPLETVILDGGISQRLLGDVQEFARSHAWYLERGIPYRRGYLLYGPPGCGKTSYIFALAGHLQYNICVLNLNERGLTDEKLSLLLSTVPPRSLVLLEDVDCVFVQRTHAQHQQHSSHTLTFSGLLNALDGVASTEERLVFMTTNYLERLDSALIRPGRVDVQQYIGYASEAQIRHMFRRFYPVAQNDADSSTRTSSVAAAANATFVASPAASESTNESAAAAAAAAAAPYGSTADELQQLCNAFVSACQSITPAVHLSVADLQGWFLLHKNQPSQAVANVHSLLEQKQAQQMMQREQRSVEQMQFQNHLQRVNQASTSSSAL